MFFIGKAGGIMWNDRGDVASHDFGIGDLTHDNNWHDLDLSGIVGVGVKLVLLHLHISTSVGNPTIYMKQNGNVNDINMVYKKFQGAGSVWDTVEVTTDANGVIEYKLILGSTITMCNITVRGWFA